ncbi:hypothetical protein BC835DRAFT_1256643, partial [Cytidiella melzeri]
MSLARAALLKPRQSVVSALVLRRPASSAAHEDHHEHHDHYEDTTVYPQESFSNKTWRNWALGGLAVALFYKFAPTPGDDAYLTRWISLYSTDKSLWADRLQKHLLLSAEGQVQSLIVADAKRPPVHRYRYPQSMEQHSAFSIPVGMSVDLSDVVVK